MTGPAPPLVPMKCPQCGALLAKVRLVPGAAIEIKCRRGRTRVSVTVAQLDVKLGGDPSGALGAINKTQGALSGLSHTLGRVGTIASGVLLAMGVRSFAHSVADFVSTTIGFEANISINSSTANPMASAVSIVRGIGLATMRSNGPMSLPMRWAKRTPSYERCEPTPRPTPFLVYE
jgi:hypothetical protein